MFNSMVIPVSHLFLGAKEVLSRSKGSAAIKIHLIVVGHGLLVRAETTGGEASDIKILAY